MYDPERPELFRRMKPKVMKFSIKKFLTFALVDDSVCYIIYCIHNSKYSEATVDVASQPTRDCHH
ncbi:hypothetical protein PROFUN_12018 [Planoprotostelium fungivorum]|uniref:Uncharacterized protein n=1 Tax=Planoprotostelium fungivorum TaxID=1890364 RepID=A0A2P6MRD6_9EUKA|nr:hypothetical protein PROFUN_12018 [Planoprotostelium fungivorum]